jgi:hypothetical protein
VSLRKRPLRPFAWLALVAFLCGWMLPFFEAHPLGLEDDTACETVAIPGPSTPDQLTPVDNGDRAPTHCLLCHLMRAMNGAVHVDVARISAPLVTAANLPAADLPARSVALSSYSSRGPPQFA